MKILVVHPAQQHSYRLAAALARKGWLDKYITTVYNKKGSLTHFVSNRLHGRDKEKAFGRNCPELNDDDVMQFCEIRGLLKLLVMRNRRLRPFYKWLKYHITDCFARKVAEYAIKNHVDAVVSYDDYSAVLFRLLKEKAPDILRVMDVSAANILYMRKIYEKDIKQKPAFAERLKKEREIVWNNENLRRTKEEIENAQIFLVPSGFVAHSFEVYGVGKSRIRMCPYGVDTSEFAPAEREPLPEETRRPIRFIYVGGVKELKGISYLLEAITHIPENMAQLTVVGQFDPEDSDTKPYRNRVRFTGSILHWEVAGFLAESDVFVFPSLGEGMSLACLEAAASGLPLIVSENSGVTDAITDGKEGFIVRIQSAEDLEEKMQWFIAHPDRIREMGAAAREMALQYTWEAYYQRIGEIFDEIRLDRWER